MGKATTVSQLIEYLTLGSAHHWSADESVPFMDWFTALCTWPPNVFAVTAAILHESGIYRVEALGESDADAGRRRNELLVSLSEEWVAALSSADINVSPCVWDHKESKPTPTSSPCCSAASFKLPAPLQDLGDNLRRALSHSVSPNDQGCDAEMRTKLIQLHATADEACFELGMPNEFRGGHAEVHERTAELRVSKFSITQLKSAQSRLRDQGTLSCLEPRKIRILPKKHTPQVGVTLRSISLWVGAVRGEVDVQWHSPSESSADAVRKLKDRGLRTNLLLIPWPFELNPLAFRSSHSNGYHQFDYQTAPFSGRDTGAHAYMVRLLDQAARIGCPIDGVVFPELALNPLDFGEVRRAIGNVCPHAFLLAGVSSSADGDFPKNQAWLGVEDKIIKQDKHHRWCLDAAQIRQYHLGAALFAPEGRKYWERMRIGPRSISFAHLRPCLTLSHLICEDLARVEPVAEVIRAVGPNLVVALLLDGPQLERRWPGRYASIFADDPGSSVLTLSALGMVRRSRGPDGQESSVVALWKDQKTGTREISMNPKARGLVLSLAANRIAERTFDGRSDGRVTGALTFTGTNEIYLSD